MIQQSHSWAIYLNKTIIATPMFITTLFTIMKTRKQTKCPLTDERIKKRQCACVCVCVCVCVMEYYSATKKNEIMPFAATWLQLEIVMLSEVSHKEKDKYYMISLSVESKIGHK